ncbi:MAG: beta-glucanase (GH16 family), partial [Myxococcota bacterium]
LDNSFVSDGTLKIVARKEQYTTEGTTLDYTSARLNARFAFTYGRVAVRARLPAEAGTWPAIWTLGANINEPGNAFGTEYGDVGWPACGEIDIMEQTGWDKDTTLAYFHWGHTETGAYETEGSDLSNPSSTTDFRVYALEWDEAYLRAWVDGSLVHELQNTDTRPYDNPHYLLLNIAMGGSLGGTVPSGFDDATMEIDYVRIYQ